MRGDFSRASFNQSKHYSGVRMQQGRVQLDADWNEQVDILHHQTTSQLTDLLGIGGAPAARPGYAITLPDPQTATNAADGLPPDVRIAFGHRYVNGILCINDSRNPTTGGLSTNGAAAAGNAPIGSTFLNQVDFPGAATHRAAVAGHAQYLIYLDVWQHHITALEDADLLEAALDGLDTTTRTKTIAQVKFWPVPSTAVHSSASTAQTTDTAADLVSVWAAFQQSMQPVRGKLDVRKVDTGVIIQNQLYRVEIQSVDATCITYKWSRENGAIAYPVVDVKPHPTIPSQRLVYLADLPAEKIALPMGAVVELVSLDDQLNGQAGQLARISETPTADPHTIPIEQFLPQHKASTGGVYSLQAASQDVDSKPALVLRLWDQRGANEQPLHGGGVILRRNQWVTLEDDIQLYFSSEGEYQVGDYWLIPVRANLEAGTGGVLWPKNHPQLPHGITHHYAPLAVITKVGTQWELKAYQESSFRTAPQLTAEVDGLGCELAKAQKKIAALEAAVSVLDNRVDLLEEAVKRINARLDVQRTQLYQDLPAMKPLEIGAVVALSQQWHNSVEAATLANERLIIGVVMEFVPDLHVDERYRIVMQGRTQCKVVGMVEAGDLLVACHLPGHAHKAGIYVQPGTLIGKALESFHPSSMEAVGLIDILVTLG